jgi:hypothetical protein
MKKYKPTIIKFFKIGMVISLIMVIVFPNKVKYNLFRYYNALEYKINGPQSPDCRNCPQLFNDGVNIHRKAYNKEKINEQKNDKGLINLNKKGVLKKIESNNNYTIRKLYHSKPLLLPKAVIFLDSLSNAYRQLCEINSLSYIPFEITSVTRTVESVSKLTKTNNNAIEESAHLHGKTFDVSYRSFYNRNKQKEAFINALSNLQKQNKCFVKFERNGCFHITAN